MLDDSTYPEWKMACYSSEKNILPGEQRSRLTFGTINAIYSWLNPKPPNLKSNPNL